MATLHDEVTINGMRLRNRIAIPPITTNYCNPEGLVNDAVLEFYKRRSKDVGLFVVEAAAIRADGRLVPNSVGLWDDGQVAGMANLVESIKNEGAATIVQINHGGARSVPLGGDLLGGSPSGYAFRPDTEAFAMNQSQIDQMVADYAEAANRAAKAGFDGVEIHGAHFYLVSQFLSPLTNTRDDRYGGDAAGRATFALEVVKAIRDKLGKDFPIIFRLNAIENVQGGQTFGEALVISRLLADAGVDCLHVSLIARSSWNDVDDKKYLVSSSAYAKDHAPGANVASAVAIKEATGLPVIAVGKLGEGTLAEDTVRDTPIDVVAIGRPLIADPDAAGKILSGHYDDIIPCEECMTCFATIGKGKPMACKVNKNLPG